MFQKIKRTLWGDLTAEEFKRFGMLASTLAFIIGTYWLMRPIKDGIFTTFVGNQFLPDAKLLSFLIVIPIILIYSKLVDLMEKQKLFYVFCGFYGVVFATIAVLLMHPTIGVANTTPDKYRLLGWGSYFAIESFGSLMVSLFWSFVASSTDTVSAKKGFALIISGAQIGSITGPFIATKAEILGLPVLAAIIAGGIFCVPLLIKLFITSFPEAAEAKVSNKKKTGPIEGIRLIFSNPYLIGIFGISTLYEVVITIIDFQFKGYVTDAYPTIATRTAFYGSFGMATNGLALCFALIGTSYFIRRYGLTFCLVMYPVTTAIVVFCCWTFPSLWVIFGALIAMKALSYALNNPCKEIMYIPTSKDVKFKAKSWMDMFGGRSAKAAGSGVVKSLITFGGISAVATLGPVVAFAIIAVWIADGLYVGRKNKHLVDTNTIIE